MMGIVMNKKYLPVGILVALFILVAGVLFAFRSNGDKSIDPEIENIPDLPVEQRPFTSLVPTSDGHYLNLIVEDINVPGASLLEYEVYYQTATGIQQGIPGRVTLTGIQTIERELLLGSESAGKFRYDEGVDDGTLTIKFRDVDGQFIGKVQTTWKLYSDTQDLASADGNFVYSLDNVTDGYFVVMETFGLPVNFENITSGPYGVFSSDSSANPGELNAEFSKFEDGEWSEPATSFDDIGIFVK